MCEQDWLAEYEALLDPQRHVDGHLWIREGLGGAVYIVAADGDCLAAIYRSPTRDVRRLAVVAVKAWEAAHE